MRWLWTTNVRSSGASPRPCRPAARETPSTRGGAGQVGGVGDLRVQMARGCRALPPDEIVGYITRGRGVSIHRRDCGNILRLRDEEQARLIDVGWSEGAIDTYPVEVAVHSFDRRGLLRDITSVIANESVNVVALESHGDDDRQGVTTVVTVEVENLSQLARVLDRLAQLPNVTDVRRRA